MKHNSSRRKLLFQYLLKPNVAGALIFLFFLFIGAQMIWQQYSNQQESQQEEMQSIISIVEENIDHALKNSYSAALSLALIINDQGEIDDFETVAPKLLDLNENIDAVQLVPDGVITKVYPFDENKEALDYDILQDSTRNAEAFKAIEKRAMYFAGPFELRQGGMAIVGRLPVFKKNEFWGFSAVIIKLPNLIHQSGIDQLAGENYRFQFSKIDVETGEEIFFLPGDWEVGEAYTENIEFSEGDWNIYITPIAPFSETYKLIPFAILIFVVSLWLGWAMARLLKKPKELEKLVEAQAGELFRSEAKFRTIFNQAAVGMVTVDTATGKFLDANARFSELLGYTQDELNSLDFKKVSHPEDIKENQLAMQALYNGEIREYTIEKRNIRKDGNLVWIKLTVSPLWLAGEEPSNHIAIIQDITKRKEAEFNLNKGYQMVTDQNRRLLNFSYIISHDLRSHTSNIQSLLNLYSLTEAEDEKETYIKLITKVSNSLNQTLYDLNEVVAIQSNVDIKLETLTVNKYLNQTVELLSFEISKKNAVIRKEVPENMQVNFNPAYFESVLLNLISNALRYSHQERNPEINVKAYQEDSGWVMEISDNGIGIDLDRHGDKLFGLYKTFTDRPNSRGVGLFITKNQIEAMGGKIEVESTPDQGTLFRMHFKG